MFTPNPSISFFVSVETADEADHLFNALLDGGQALMPIGTYPWSQRYGWVKDRFGVSWQVIAGRRAGQPAIFPCLMFAGAIQGKAEEAIRLYTKTFPNGRVDAVERYTATEGPEGTIKHGRFFLDDQVMVVMDARGGHGFTFNEGLSLQVMCDDQAEVDRYWTALSEGGEQGPCGWLKDRFGLSWQVVPRILPKLLTTGDAASRDRAFAALMKMKKLDVAALERAFAGS
jgi:predicted 3-demethylubiquinone-9 3-methyltransferase (glyoxalase superfamily)